MSEGYSTKREETDLTDEFHSLVYAMSRGEKIENSADIIYRITEALMCYDNLKN